MVLTTPYLSAKKSPYNKQKDNKRTTNNCKSPNKYEINPGLETIKSAKPPPSLRKHRSRTRLKSLYNRFDYLKNISLRSAVSKSPDSRYLSFRSCSTISLTSKSRLLPSSAGSTYTIASSKPVCTSSPKLLLSCFSRSLTFVDSSFHSISPDSCSTISRPSCCTYKLQNPRSSRHVRHASSSTTSKHLESFPSKVRQSTLTLSTTTIHSCRSPSKLPCWVPSPRESIGMRSKSPLRSQMPKKSCLRSPVPHRLNSVSTISKPHSLNYSIHSKKLPRKTLSSRPFISISINAKSLKLKSNENKSSPSKRSQRNRQSASPRSKAPHKSVSFKSTSSKSVDSLSSESRTSVFSSCKFDDLNSERPRSPQPPRRIKPFVRFSDEITSAPRPFSKGISNQHSEESKILNIMDNNHAYLMYLCSKRRLKLPATKQSRLSVKRRSRSRQRLKGGKRNQSLDKLDDSPELRSKLIRQIKNDLNRIHLAKVLTRKYDIRYLTDLKSYLGKIKSSFKCGPDCPELQKRRRMHQMYCRKENLNQAPGRESQKPRISFADLKSTPYFVEERNRPDTIESEILQWSKKIPSKTETPEEARRQEIVIQNLIDKINSMDTTRRDSDAQNSLRSEIESCLDNMNLWYLGSKGDRQAFKEGLRENLFEKIYNRNENFLNGDLAMGSKRLRTQNSLYAGNINEPFGNYEQQNVAAPYEDVNDQMQSYIKTAESIPYKYDSRASQTLRTSINAAQPYGNGNAVTPSVQQPFTASTPNNVAPRYINTSNESQLTQPYENLSNLPQHIRASQTLRTSTYKAESHKSVLNGPQAYENQSIATQPYGNGAEQAYRYQNNTAQPYGNGLNGTQAYENQNNAAQPYGNGLNEAEQAYRNQNNAAQPYGNGLNEAEQAYRNQNNAAQPYGNGLNEAEQAYRNQNNAAQPYGNGLNGAGQAYRNQNNAAQTYGNRLNGAEQAYKNQNNAAQPYGNGLNGAKQAYRNQSNAAQPYGNTVDAAQSYMSNIAQPYGNAVTSSIQQPFKTASTADDIAPHYSNTSNESQLLQQYKNLSNVPSPYGKLNNGTQPDGNVYQPYRNSDYVNEGNVAQTQPSENVISEHKQPFGNSSQPYFGTNNLKASNSDESEAAQKRQPENQNYGRQPDGKQTYYKMEFPNNTIQNPSNASYTPLTPNQSMNDAPMEKNKQNLQKYSQASVKIQDPCNENDAYSNTCSCGTNEFQSNAPIIPILKSNPSYTFSGAKKFCIKQQQVEDEILRNLNACNKIGLSINEYSDDPTMKCTIRSSSLCICPADKRENIKKQEDLSGFKQIDINREVADWLKMCTFIRFDDSIMSRQDIIDGLVIHISPYLSQPCNNLNKGVLKTKIVNYLRGIRFCIDTTSGCLRNVLNKQANELANRLVGIVSRLECSGPTSWKCHMRTNRPFKNIEQIHIGPNQVNREDFKYDLIQEFVTSLYGTKLENNKEVLEAIAELIIDRIELIRQNINETIKKDIICLLENTHLLRNDEIYNITDTILKISKDIVNMISSVNKRTNTTIMARPCLSRTLTIYTSEQEFTPNFAGTSTPKKKKDLSKLSVEEKEYTNNIATAIKDWIKTVPINFKNLNDDNMNEVMIMDLAANIADHAKLGQLIPHQNIDKEKIITYYIYNWLVKFEILENFETAEPYVGQLMNNLLKVDVPKLTRPQNGSRQTMKNIQHIEGEAWSDPFIPEAQDILEDEISIWMNEYPSSYYLTQNESSQNKLIRSLAEKLQKHNKHDDIGISNEINKWLKMIVKPTEKHMLDVMSKSLKERIYQLPQDDTIVRKMQEKFNNKKRLSESISPIDISQTINYDENDKTMKEFIIKYVEQSFDQEDPLAKAVYAKLFKHELQRLSPHLLKEVYEGKRLERVSPSILFRELEFIKDISDWLKTLPFKNKYNQVANNDRIEFCLYLARDIAQTEEERLQSPNAMNYDQYLGNIVCQFMHQLPLKLDKTNLTKHIHQLLIKILSRRCECVQMSPQQQWADIGDFLDDYIRLNGQDIANDEVKLEAWATRLLKEIKIMIAENQSTLTETHVIGKLGQVMKPGDETIKRFDHELYYAKEISDWLKNFPLVDNLDEEIIRDLAEKMAENENTTDNSELIQYLEQWILVLPLDKSKEIDIPFVIQQLMNRKQKVFNDKGFKNLPIVRRESTSQFLLEEELPKNSGAKTECRGCCPVDNPGSIIVQVIKEWCDKLPLQGAEEDIKSYKSGVETKLYQKIIEINDDPHLAHNDTLYIELVSEKVRELLKNLPVNLKLNSDEVQLKDELLKLIKQARLFCRDVNMGDDYVKELENAIEVAIPNAKPQRAVDPAFEIYKEYLTDLFILENFDHGNDSDKLKYEKIIRKEIEKYSAYALQRINIPITEEKLCNDTISTLFDIIMPEERALADNVEEIKTKCEILDWFEQLPLRSFNGLGELVEMEQKIRLLSKKLHTLESNNNPDQSVHKEITKWLTKISLLPREQENIDFFTDILQDKLRKTRNSRKCIKASVINVSKGRVTENEFHDLTSVWVNPNTTFDRINRIQQPPRPKTEDILFNIVEQWSENVPLPPLPKNTQETIKDDLAKDIIKKIEEINIIPSTFNDDMLYNHLLNQEIGKAMASLPRTDTLIQNQYALLGQLTSAINSIKPLIREERALQEYKKNLNQIVTSALGHPEKPTPEENNMLSKIREEVVTDFIEYQYNKEDAEGKQFYKNKILDALTEYNSIGEIEDNKNDVVSDTLVEVNKLLCELKKIIPPDEQTLKNEVEELRMKQEVDILLNKISPEYSVSTDTQKPNLRDSLAKQLNDIEKTGHDETNNKKMETTIVNALEKHDFIPNEDEIKTFIKRLQTNEAIRKAPAYHERAAYGNYSLSENFGSNSQWIDPGPFATSVPVSCKMCNNYKGPMFEPQPQNALLFPDTRYCPNSSKAQRDLLTYPPTDSVSYDYPHAIHQQVNVSVYQPDYVPPNWKPPTSPPVSYNQKLLTVPPHQFRSNQGSIGASSIPVRQTLTQPTQTATFSSGVSQTGRPPGMQFFDPRTSSPYPPRPFAPPMQPAPGNYIHPQSFGKVGPPPQFGPRMPHPMTSLYPGMFPGIPPYPCDDDEDECSCSSFGSDHSLECIGPRIPFMMPPFMFC